jgi:hypothetical protein
MKATYHNRWPTREQIFEWTARAACAWKYSTKAQQSLWVMQARQNNNNKQPLCKDYPIPAEECIKILWGVVLDIGECFSPSIIQSWLVSFKLDSIYVEIKSTEGEACNALAATRIEVYNM